MNSAPTSRVSVSGIPDDTLDELDALAEAEDKSRSEKIVELIEAEVGERLPDDNDEYRPSDPSLNTVYSVAVDHAKQHQLRFDLHKSKMATETGIPATALRGYLVSLQREGYVKHQMGDALGSGSDADFWRIKPLCANPRAWRYSEVYDPEYVAQLEAMTPEETLDSLESAEPARSQADD
ncbi:CopG family ribbon-helix-helix protein [Salarchaeum japonicum]|uniref:CopG family ribbon-helix-helix protein n=1 Tax=Salarchaeum japonicum TaxID=555573 RepID=UPI003C72AFB6